MLNNPFELTPEELAMEGELFLKGEQAPIDRVNSAFRPINCRCVLVSKFNEKEIASEKEKSPLLLPEPKA